MNDIITPWMAAGGIRADWHDPHARHRIAMREARRLARADRPGVLDRVRAWSRTLNPNPATHRCEA